MKEVFMFANMIAYRISPKGNSTRVKKSNTWESIAANRRLAGWPLCSNVCHSISDGANFYFFCSKGFQSTWTNQCDLWKWLVKNNRSLKYLKIWGFIKFSRFHQFHYSAFWKAPTSDTETLLFDDGNWSSDHTTRYNKGYCTDAILGVFTGIILLLMTQAIQAGQSLNQGQQRTRNFFPVQVFVSFSAPGQENFVQVDSSSWTPDPLIPSMTVDSFVHCAMLCKVVVLNSLGFRTIESFPRQE